MQLLWIHVAGQWNIVPLDGSQVGLAAGAVRPVASGVWDAPAVLLAAGNEKDQWVLIARAGASVEVNGDRVVLGARVLRDRDAIQIDGGERMYFSAEANPRIVAYAGEKNVICPRCNTAISPGQLVVKCPHCRTHHHQTADLGCWLYDVRCQCGQATDLSPDNQWSPEEC